MNMSIDVSPSELLFVFSRSCYSLGLPAGIRDDVGILTFFIARLGLEPCSSLNDAFIACESLKNDPVLDISVVEEDDRYIISSHSSSNLSCLACGPILQDWFDKNKFIELRRVDDPAISFLFLVALAEDKQNIYCQFGENRSMAFHQNRILSNFPLFSELKENAYDATIKYANNVDLKDYSHEYPLTSTLKDLESCRVDDELWQVFLERFKKSLVATIDDSGAGE